MSDKKSESMETVMGFGGFGKKARTFDLQAIFEETRRNAQERSRQAKEKEALNSGNIPICRLVAVQCTLLLETYKQHRNKYCNGSTGIFSLS